MKDAVNVSSFRRRFLGPWDGMAEPAMAAVTMVRGGVPWFAMLDISRANACVNFLSVFNYGNLRFFCGHYNYTTRTIGNEVPTFLRDLYLRAYKKNQKK